MPAVSVTEDPRGAVIAALRGDRAAFARLYAQYSQPAYNLVLRSVRDPKMAEDLCQEIWIKAHRELANLRDPTAFPKWLYRIAARACIDAARQRSSTPLMETLSDYLAISPGPDPERAVIQREQAQLAWEALSALPTRQHIALFLKEVEEHSYREIAQIMKTSESAVETLLFRARLGFGKAYKRLEATKTERCRLASRAMAALIDGEATSVQRQALMAHVDACASCRGQIGKVRQARTIYASLALTPVPAVLAQRVFDALAIGSWAGTVATLAKIIALAASKGKLLTMTVLMTGGLTVATLMAPGRPYLPPENVNHSSAASIVSPDASIKAEAHPSGINLSDENSEERLAQERSTTSEGESKPKLLFTTSNLSDLVGKVATAGVSPSSAALVETIESVVPVEGIANDISQAAQDVLDNELKGQPTVGSSVINTINTAESTADSLLNSTEVSETAADSATLLANVGP